MDMDVLIQTILEEQFQPTHFELINDSHKHAGHAGDDGSGQTHYTLVMASARFNECNRIQRQRLVLDALKGPFSKGLHAISMKLFVPDDVGVLK